MKKWNCAFLLCFCFCLPYVLNAQIGNVDTTTAIVRKEAQLDSIVLLQEGDVELKKDAEKAKYMCSVNEGTMLGVGGYMMKDSYLSNEKYGGIGFRMLNERMRLIPLANYNMSRQKIINVDISSAVNGAENANFLSAFVDYSLGYHYRFHPNPSFKILVGGAAHGMLGMVYNTRNGNNPMTIHADIDLNVSLAAIYGFYIRKYPLALRLQCDMPFMGVLFSPVYDQSYYEIFSLGNTAEIIKFNSFGNKFAMRNYLTLDFPIGGMTVRAGYFGNIYCTHLNNIDRCIVSHNFIIGFVKEFMAFGGREMRKRNLFRSAYY